MCDSSNLNIDALLLDPNVRGQIITKLMKLKSLFQPDEPSPTTTTSAPSPARPAGFPSLPDGIPTDLLENPTVQEFIKNNPEIVAQIASEGLPSPDKLEALLSLAAPPPEGVEQGLFGPDIFAGEEFDVQGFGDYEYDDEYYDYDEDINEIEKQPPSTVDDYPEYGNFEGENNEVDGRQGKKIDHKTEAARNSSKRAVIKLKYRLITPSVVGNR